MTVSNPGPTAAESRRLEELIEDWSTSSGRAVLFDFNGTLSHDEPILLRIFTEMFLDQLQWTLTPRHYYSRLAGRSDREIIGLLIEELAPDSPELYDALLKERRLRYRELVEDRCPVLPDTADLVRLLHAASVPLGIVTGAEREDVDHVLHAAGLTHALPAIVAASDVSAGKPDPEGFLRAASTLGVAESDVLVFEDSIHGITAAHSAGMRCIAVAGTRPRAELEAVADAVIDSFDGTVVERFRAGVDNRARSAWTNSPRHAASPAEPQN